MNGDSPFPLVYPVFIAATVNIEGPSPRAGAAILSRQGLGSIVFVFKSEHEAEYASAELAIMGKETPAPPQRITSVAELKTTLNGLQKGGVNYVGIDCSVSRQPHERIYEIGAIVAHLEASE